MIGLLFFGAIALWGVIAIALGTKLPKWLGIQRYRVLWAVVLVPLIFFAPVADEIIAYPQMQSLCKENRMFEFAPGIDEKKAHGRTVYSEERNTNTNFWPPSVKVLHWTTAYVDATTKELLFQRSGAHPQRGFLGLPNGSSGGAMTVLLGPCAPTGEAFDSAGIPTSFSKLSLKKIPKP